MVFCPRCKGSGMGRATDCDGLARLPKFVRELLALANTLAELSQHELQTFVFSEALELSKRASASSSCPYPLKRRVEADIRKAKRRSEWCGELLWE